MSCPYEVLSRASEKAASQGCSGLKCDDLGGGVYLVTAECRYGEKLAILESGDQRLSEPDVASMIIRGELPGIIRSCLVESPAVKGLELRSIGQRSLVFDVDIEVLGRATAKMYVKSPVGNPEVDVLLYLTSLGFPLSPRLICSFKSSSGDPLMIVVERVRGEPLARHFITAAARSVSEQKVVRVEYSRLLGRAIGMLHEALHRCREPWCSPEVAGESRVESWFERLRYRARLLKEMAGGDLLTLEASDALEDLADDLRDLKDKLAESVVMRIHGDLHLYQVYYDEGRLVFTDFEGEPGKAPAGASEKEPPARDLAAILRSIDYAAVLGVELAYGSDLDTAIAIAVKGLSEWERVVASDLINHYLEYVSRAISSDLASQALETMRFWLVERASYEAVYELVYKTGYHLIPLNAILRIHEGSDPLLG